MPGSRVEKLLQYIAAVLVDDLRYLAEARYMRIVIKKQLVTIMQPQGRVDAAHLNDDESHAAARQGFVHGDVSPVNKAAHVVTAGRAGGRFDHAVFKPQPPQVTWFEYFFKF